MQFYLHTVKHIRVILQYREDCLHIMLVIVKYLLFSKSNILCMFLASRNLKFHENFF